MKFDSVSNLRMKNITRRIFSNLRTLLFKNNLKQCVEILKSNKKEQRKSLSIWVILNFKKFESNNCRVDFSSRFR
jgi:hypothetical protein